MTSDAATIIREIEVVHPAAKLLVMASQAQESEVSSSVPFLGARTYDGIDGRLDQYGFDISWRIAEKIRISAYHGLAPE